MCIYTYIHINAIFIGIKRYKYVLTFFHFIYLKNCKIQKLYLFGVTKCQTFVEQKYSTTAQAQDCKINFESRMTFFVPNYTSY